MRLRVFLQFFFSNIVSACFNYIIHVVSFVQETLEKRLSSCQNVWFCYCTEINIVNRNLCFVHKTTYLWSMSGPGGGELSLFACPGVGNRPPSENKIANPRGYARGGMVTGRIEPCIIHSSKCKAYVEQICIVDSCNFSLIRNVTQHLKHLELTETVPKA